MSVLGKLPFERNAGHDQAREKYFEKFRKRSVFVSFHAGGEGFPQLTGKALIWATPLGIEELLEQGSPLLFRAGFVECRRKCPWVVLEEFEELPPSHGDSDQ